MRLVDEFERVLRDLVVDGLHPFLRQRPGVFHSLPTFAVAPAMKDTARAEELLELRVLRIIRVLGLFFRIEVVQVAEKLIEAVHRWQELILVAQMVLAKLSGGIAERLQKFGDGRIFRL